MLAHYGHDRLVQHSQAYLQHLEVIQQHKAVEAHQRYMAQRNEMISRQQQQQQQHHHHHQQHIQLQHPMSSQQPQLVQNRKESLVMLTPMQQMYVRHCSYHEGSERRRRYPALIPSNHGSVVPSLAPSRRGSPPPMQQPPVPSAVRRTVLQPQEGNDFCSCCRAHTCSRATLQETCLCHMLLGPTRGTSRQSPLSRSLPCHGGG